MGYSSIVSLANKATRFESFVASPLNRGLIALVFPPGKRKADLANLKGHKLVIWFWRPGINFNPVFCSNGKKFNAMEIY